MLVASQDKDLIGRALSCVRLARKVTSPIRIPGVCFGSLDWAFDTARESLDRERTLARRTASDQGLRFGGRGPTSALASTNSPALSFAARLPLGA
jgi:hypothetical protein